MAVKDFVLALLEAPTPDHGGCRCIPDSCPAVPDDVEVARDADQ